MVVEIDGSLFEGGGSMLRNSIALSLQTQKPVKIINIRKNRSKPGLQPQHLASVKLAQKMSGSDVQGLELGSTELLFMPQKIRAGVYEIDIGTAGSIPLMIQSILLPTILSGQRFLIRAKGGTDVPNAMGIDYLNTIFSFALKDYATITADTIRRGYYPEGNGRVDINITAKYSDFDKEDFPPIDISEIIMLQKVSVKIVSSKQNSDLNILERITEYLTMDLSKMEYDHSISSFYQEAQGNAITALVSLTGISNEKEVMLGESLLFNGSEGSEIIAEKIRACIKYYSSQKVPCDFHLADQMIAFIPLLEGKIFTSKITDHVLSNIYVAQKFTGCNFVTDNGLISLQKKN